MGIKKLTGDVTFLCNDQLKFEFVSMDCFFLDQSDVVPMAVMNEAIPHVCDGGAVVHASV
jgi:hypothetical protein